MARKKAARKVRRSKKRVRRKSITVILKQGVDPAPKHPELSPARHDRIRFWNKTNRGRAIEFPLWPFVEPPQQILVKAHRRSAWFTIFDETPQNSAYGYAAYPDLAWPGDGPPGNPDVVASD